VQIQPVTEAVAGSLGLDEARGVLVADVLVDSPAAAAGVRSGDVIIRAAGQQMDEYRDLTKLVASIEAGTRSSWRSCAAARCVSLM
jgi:serine protease Do